MSEQERDEPRPEDESRVQRTLRQTHTTRLYSALVLGVAGIVLLILLIARNTRHVKVDYVFGSGHARLIWLVVISSIIGWVLGIVTAFFVRRRTRWRGPA